MADKHNNVNHIETDVLVVGGCAAGMFAAETLDNYQLGQEIMLEDGKLVSSLMEVPR
jgi:thioredoxin reductase